MYARKVAYIVFSQMWFFHSTSFSNLFREQYWNAHVVMCTTSSIVKKLQNSVNRDNAQIKFLVLFFREFLNDSVRLMWYFWNVILKILFVLWLVGIRRISFLRENVLTTSNVYVNNRYFFFFKITVDFRRHFILFYENKHKSTRTLEKKKNCLFGKKRRISKHLE